MSEIDKHLLEIYSRLSLYEFLLEIHHANLFRNMLGGDVAFEKFRADVLDRIEHRSYVLGAPSEMDVPMELRVAELADNFFEKVARRMAT